MNMQASANNGITPEAIKARLYGLTFKSCDALAKTLKGGPVGFNPFTQFTARNGRPMVEQYADYILETFQHKLVAIHTLLPQYETRSRKAREFIAAKKGIPVPETGTTYETDTATDDTDTDTEDTDTPAIEPPTAQQPKPEPIVYQPGTLEHSIQQIVRQTLAGETFEAGVNPAQVVDIVRPFIKSAIERAMLPTVTHIHVTRTDANGGTHTENMGRQHKSFTKLLKRAELRLNVWLAGPAGSGKTTAADNVAKALGLPFYFTGSIDTEYKLLGFTDAAGNTVRTSFREAWEHGGVFLFDECDGSAASALLALNAALANGACAFPDGVIPKHRDCIIIAAANTWGTGATFEYVGRAKLDAASMDRFVRMVWEYDWALVKDTCGNPAWCDKVMRYRDNVSNAGIKGHIISPRAVYSGAKMLAAGIPEAEVIEELITPGLTPDQTSRVIR